MPQTQVKLKEVPPNNIDAIGADMMGSGGSKELQSKKGCGGCLLRVIFAGVAVAAIAYYCTRDGQNDQPVEKNTTELSAPEF